MLEKSLSSTSDPLLLKLLKDEVAKTKAAQKPKVIPDEAFRHASAAWRDAGTRRDQAAQAVFNAKEIPWESRA